MTELNFKDINSLESKRTIWHRLVGFIGIILILILILWSVYWLLVYQTVSRSIDEWMVENNQRGVSVKFTSLDISGYPLWFDVKIKKPVVRLKKSRVWVWRLPLVKAKFRPWNLSNIFVDLDGLHHFEGAKSVVLQARKLKTTIDLSSSRGWRARFAGEDLNAEVKTFGKVAAKNIVVETDWPGQIITVDTLAPRIDVIVNSLRVPIDWALPLGNQVATFRLEAHLKEEPGPFRDFNGLIQWRDKGGTVEVTRLNLDHGPIRLNGEGTFALDRDLQPVGALTVRVEGLTKIVDVLLRKNIIGVGQATAVTLLLAALTERPVGQVPHIKAPLTLQDRELSFQSFSFMKIPKINWPNFFTRVQK